MKTIYIAAVALAFATPAAAQSHAEAHATPAASTTPADHAGHAQPNHGPAHADHSKHAGCCGDANGNGKMDCCKGDEAAQRPCCAKHAGKSGAQPK